MRMASQKLNWQFPLPIWTEWSVEFGKSIMTIMMGSCRGPSSNNSSKIFWEALVWRVLRSTSISSSTFTYKSTYQKMEILVGSKCKSFCLNYLRRQTEDNKPKDSTILKRIELEFSIHKFSNKSSKYSEWFSSKKGEIKYLIKIYNIYLNYFRFLWINLKNFKAT